MMMMMMMTMMMMKSTRPKSILLGRLFGVDLITLEGEMSVRK